MQVTNHIEAAKIKLDLAERIIIEAQQHVSDAVRVGMLPEIAVGIERRFEYLIEESKTLNSFL